MTKTPLSERPAPTTAWCIARHHGDMSTRNQASYLTLSTLAYTKRQAWVKFLDLPAEDVSPNASLMVKRWVNTPANRAWWRRRGTRPVRVILHTLGERGCKA